MKLYQHNFSKIKSHKVTKQWKSRFFLLFCLMIEGFGSGRPKNIRILRIRNNGKNICLVCKKCLTNNLPAVVAGMYYCFQCVDPVGSASVFLVCTVVSISTKCQGKLNFFPENFSILTKIYYTIYYDSYDTDEKDRALHCRE